ncbi:MAG: NUDIX hydrolase [Chitinophagales bacterium]
MYKIFINEIPVFIREEGAPNTHENADKNNPVYFFTQRKEIFKAIQQIEAGGKIRSLTIHGDDAKAVRDYLFVDYKLITAAGGLVMNDNKEILMIYRHSLWDLPKGKIELGEKPKKAALREVKEETGISHLKLIKKLTKTYHTYLINENKVLKKTIWFLMQSNDRVFTPQVTEGIETVKWINTVDMESKYKHTYGNIRDVIDAGIIAAYLL